MHSKHPDRANGQIYITQWGKEFNIFPVIETFDSVGRRCYSYFRAHAVLLESWEVGQELGGN